MILDPDFLDHWKTRLFVEMMGEEHATNYILRLWFHCQQRRTTNFEGMTSQILKVVCRYSGDGEKLMKAMIDCGFAVGYPNGISVPKWAEANSKMLANWHNGMMGGRPPSHEPKHAKTSDKTHEITQPEPNDNPHVTGRKEGMVGLEIEGRDGVGGEEDGFTGNTIAVDALEGFPEEAKQPSLQAAIAYQTRRYGGPNPGATWYKDLLHEAGSVFEVQPDPKAALNTFLTTCRALPTKDLPRNAPFSKIAEYCGLKKSKYSEENPWEASKKKEKDDGMKAMREAILGKGKI